MAASVGDDVSDPAGMLSGSNSRSGMGGESRGRRVMRSKASRRHALKRRSGNCLYTRVWHALYHFKQDYAPPTSLLRHLAAQSHLEQELGEANQLQSAGEPLVAGILVTPSSGVARVGSGGEDGFVLRIGLADFGEKCVVVHAHDVQRCRNCTWGTKWHQHTSKAHRDCETDELPRQAQHP